MKHLIILTIFGLQLTALSQTSSWQIELEVKSWPIQLEQDFKDILFSGRVDVDTAAITEAATQQISHEASSSIFSLSQDFDGKTYTAEDDSANGHPVLDFSNGILTGVDFRVFFSQPDYSVGSFLWLLPDGNVQFSPDGVSEYEGTYRVDTVSAVPEPSSALLLLISSLTLTFRRNR